MKFILLLFFLSSVACNGQSLPGSGPGKESLKNYDISLTKLADSLKVKKSQARIVVNKSKYILSIVSDTLVIKSYPVVFGFNPVDDKLREGDGCTPEGKFKIKAMYPHQWWSKFIWFDYPNDESRVKHRKAIEKGLIPKDCRIGGDVGIHGVPEGSDYAIDRRQNWTLGCVSLKNKDIDEIYEFAFVGMIVEIGR